VGDAAQAGAFSSSSLPLMSSGEPSPAKKLRVDQMAARRAVTFVTGNAKKLQEVCGGPCTNPHLLADPALRQELPHARAHAQTPKRVCPTPRPLAMPDAQRNKFNLYLQKTWNQPLFRII
jgi:hypothetical protein